MRRKCRMRGDSLGKNQERHQQLKKGEEVANETEGADKAAGEKPRKCFRKSRPLTLRNGKEVQEKCPLDLATWTSPVTLA